jgi:hypothetical protein
MLDLCLAKKNGNKKYIEAFCLEINQGTSSIFHLEDR